MQELVWFLSGLGILVFLIAIILNWDRYNAKTSIPAIEKMDRVEEILTDGKGLFDFLAEQSCNSQELIVGSWWIRQLEHKNMIDYIDNCRLFLGKRITLSSELDEYEIQFT
jgi:hypothetical protein